LKAMRAGPMRRRWLLEERRVKNFTRTPLPGCDMKSG
jgi:hypothetical protein